MPKKRKQAQLKPTFQTGEAVDPRKKNKFTFLDDFINKTKAKTFHENSGAQSTKTLATEATTRKDKKRSREQFENQEPMKQPKGLRNKAVPYTKQKGKVSISAKRTKTCDSKHDVLTLSKIKLIREAEDSCTEGDNCQTDTYQCGSDDESYYGFSSESSARSGYYDEVESKDQYSETGSDELCSQEFDASVVEELDFEILKLQQKSKNGKRSLKKKIEFKVYEEEDLFEEKIRKKMFEKHLIKVEDDDDVQTDEETLRYNKKLCLKDLKEGVRQYVKEKDPCQIIGNLDDRITDGDIELNSKYSQSTQEQPSTSESKLILKILNK